MEIKVSDARWAMDDKGVWLQLLVDKGDNVRVRQFVGGFNGEHTAKIKPYKKRRSLDANAYCWLLIDKLAEKLQLPPVEVYRSFIPDVAGNSVIWPVKEELADDIARMWCDGHIGRMTERLGACRSVEGYVNLKCYIGSSDYDTAQMHRLLELVIAECKEQGIETMTPDEVMRLEAVCTR